MTMFVSKVWGFDNPCGPLVFSTAGRRENAQTHLKPGDYVLLVGTFGDETKEADRNRILGMMEPSTKAVSTSDFPLPNPDDHRLFRADGSYRWPFALLNYHAWEFLPGLFLKDVAPRPGNAFGSAAASGIVPLTTEEEARVLAHPHHKIPLIESVAANQKLYGKKIAARRGAPVPPDGIRQWILQMRNAPAYVYWFRLLRDNRNVGHKIGWAFDYEKRLQQFQRVSLEELGGLTYENHRHQLLGTARLAFSVEQSIFKRLDHLRHPSNREVLTSINVKQLESIWLEEVTAVMLRRPKK